MSASYQFDARTVDPSQAQSQLPLGKHVVVATSVAWRDAASGQGQMAAFTLTIQQGEYAGVSGGWNLNLRHTNQQTMGIAQKQLSALCHAVQHYTIQQGLDELLHKPFMVEVAPQNTEAGKEKGYVNIKILDLQGNEPKAQQVQQPVQQAQQPQPPQGQPAQGQNWSAPAPQQQPQSTPAPAQNQAPQGQQPAWGSQPQMPANPPWAQ